MSFQMRKNFNQTFSHMLQIVLKLAFMFLALTCLSGCFTASPDDDRMPQGRPASWEYSLPGGFDRGGLR